MSRIIKVVLNFPAAVGANVTEILQLPPGGSGAVHPFVTLNGSSAPVSPCISAGTPGVFLLPLGLLTVIVLGPLLLPTFTVPKFSDGGWIFSLTCTGVGVAVGVAVDVAVAVAVGVDVGVAV